MPRISVHSNESEYIMSKCIFCMRGKNSIWQGLAYLASIKTRE